MFLINFKSIKMNLDNNEKMNQKKKQFSQWLSGYTRKHIQPQENQIKQK